MRLRRADLTRIVWVTAALVAAAAGAAALAGVGSPAGVAAGGVFMVANFNLIRMLVSRLIRPGANKAITVVLLAGKFFLVLALLVGVLVQFPVEPMSFAVGATMLIIAAVLESTVLGDLVGPLDEEDAESSDS